MSNSRFRRPLLVGLSTFAFVSAFGGGLASRSLSAQDAKPSAEAQAKAIALKMAKLKNYADELEKERSLQSTQLREIRDAFRSAARITPESYLAIIQNVEREAFNLDIEVSLAGMRQEVLRDAVAKELKKGEEQGATDRVADHLKEIIGGRKAALTRLEELYKKGSVSEEELRKAQTEMAEAQVRWELRREEMQSKVRSYSVTDRLNQQLREQSIDTVQQELRLKLLQKKLDNLSGLRNQFDEYRRITEQELPRLEQMIATIKARIFETSLESP